MQKMLEEKQEKRKIEENKEKTSASQGRAERRRGAAGAALRALRWSRARRSGLAVQAVARCAGNAAALRLLEDGAAFVPPERLPQAEPEGPAAGAVAPDAVAPEELPEFGADPLDGPEGEAKTHGE